MANLNITNIPAPRVPFIDERTGLMAREWYRFFLNLFVLTGSGNNPITLEELQLGPPNQPDLTELLIQINQNIAPQYEDQSGDFLATLDTAQLMSMMSRFENAEAAIQGAYLQPVVQTGTIANYNLDGSPTAGGIAYGTGPALAVSAAGSSGQVLTSAGAAAPTWATPTTGTVSSVSVVSANGLAGTVATATTTPAITLSTTITGLLKGNGTAISAATSGTDYAPATSGTSILYGNGAGGFSNVTIGTGVAFSAGTLSATGSGGTVTSVSGTTGRITSTGGTTPVIDLVSGIATPGTTGSVSLIPVVTIDTYGRVTSITTAANPQGTVTSVAALTLGTTGTDLTSTVANGTTTPVITLNVPTASASNRGALSAADWTTFNSKVTMTYPNSGIPNSTGSAWGTSYSTTGSGTVVALATSPSFTTPTLGAALATSIKFGSGSVLSTYEEGTWTPSLGGSATYLAQSGFYTKIGNVVHFKGLLYINAIGTGSTTQITGLPFAISAQGGAVCAAPSYGGIATAISSMNLNVSGTTIYCQSNVLAATGNQTANPIFAGGTYIEFSGTYAT